MILPNSRAYTALQKRLKDVASLHKNMTVPDEEDCGDLKGMNFSFEELRMCFIEVNLPYHNKMRMSLQIKPRDMGLAKDYGEFKDGGSV